MMAQSLAEKYRNHRAAFLLAQELGCTPREAEAELRRRAARKQWQGNYARLQAKQNATPAARMASNPEPAPELWWMKD